MTRARNTLCQTRFEKEIYILQVYELDCIIFFAPPLRATSFGLFFAPVFGHHFLSREQTLSCFQQKNCDLDSGDADCIQRSWTGLPAEGSADNVKSGHASIWLRVLLPPTEYGPGAVLGIDL